MHFDLSSLLFFLLTICITSYTGLGLSLLLKKIPNEIRLLITPIFGFILISLTTAYGSYIGINSSQIILPLGIFFFLSSSLVIMIKRQLLITLIQEFIKTSWQWWALAFALINATVLLLPTILHNTAAIFGDNTIYITVSQYLQHHSYFQIAPSHTELWTDLMSYQQLCFLRMGSQFFLSFFTALLNVPHTIYMYPSVAAFGEFSFILAISVLVSSTLKRTSQELFFVLLFITLSIVLGVGQVFDYFPQIFGLTVLVFLFAHILHELYSPDDHTINITTILATASLILTYQELVPFYIFSLLFTTAYLYLSKQITLKKSLSIPCNLILALALFPISSYVFAKGVLIQANAVVGSNISFSLLDYALLLFSQSTVRNGQVFLQLISTMGAMGTCILISITLYKNIREPAKWLQKTLLMSSGFLFGFFIFRFFSINPFDHSLGNTWSLFKLVIWSFWIFFIIAGITISQFFSKKGLASVITTICILSIIPGAMTALVSTANHKINDTISLATNQSSQPFADYKSIANLASDRQYTPANVFANVLPANTRLMILVLLQDISRGDFIDKEDRIFNNHQTTAELSPSTSISFAPWISYLLEHAASQSPVKTIGGFTIYPPGTSVVYFKKGFQQREEDPSTGTTLAWMNDNDAEIRFLVPETKSAQFSVRINSIDKGTLTILDSNQVLIETISFDSKNQEKVFNSATFGTGFHRIYLKWNIQNIATKADTKNIILMFKNPKVMEIANNGLST